MLRWILFAAVCLGMVGLVMAAEEAKTCKIAGKVIDIATGKEARGVMVSAWVMGGGGAGQRFFQQKADENGEFSFNVSKGSRLMFQWQDSPEGDYLIDDKWRQEGNWQPIPDLRVTADRTGLVLKVKLVPTRELRGKVVNEKGEAVPGAMVYVGARMVAAQTDNKGEFRVKTAPRDRDFDLLAVREGAAFLGFGLSRMVGGVAHVKATDGEVTVKVANGRRYDGMVKNGAGLPAADLTFTIMPKLNGETVYQVNQSVTTNAEGKFSVKSLIPGVAYEASWSPGNETNRDYDYGTAIVDLGKVKEGELIQFEAMQYLNALMGKVVDANGQPIEGAVIAIKGRKMLPQDLWRGQSIATNAKGEFEIPRMAAGNVQLHVSAKGYKGSWFTTATDNVDFVARLNKAEGQCELRIVVVDEDGKPIAGAPVSLKNGSQNLPIEDMSVKTDETGAAKVELPVVEMTPGNRPIVAVCDMEGRDFGLAAIPLNEEGDVKMVVKKSGLPWRGRVTDDEGRPVVGARIQVVSVDLAGEETWVPIRGLAQPNPDFQNVIPPAITDADGRFELKRLGGYGMVQANCSARGFVEHSFNLSAATDAGGKQKEVALLAACEVKGKVVIKGTGKAPAEKPGMMINLRPAGPGNWVQMQAGAGWQFGSNEVGAGMYQVQIQPMEPRTARYVCTEPPMVDVKKGTTTEIVIEVEEGIRLAGKLLDAKTEKAIQGTILARLIGDESDTQTFAHAEEDGRWLLYVPREGEYQLLYYVQGARQYKVFGNVKVERAKESPEIVIKGNPE